MTVFTPRIPRRRWWRVLVLLASVLGIAQVAPAGAVWTTDYAAAVAKAKREHKEILLDFTGSDWCSWCIKLDKDVYETPEFASYATKNLVLVTLDFPEHTKLSAALQKQNDALGRKYQLHGYPTTILLDENEKFVTAMVGYVEGGPKVFTMLLDMKTAAAFINRAHYKSSGQDYDGAIADYTQAITLDAESIDAYVNRALIKESKRDDAGAVADFKHAVQIDPKNAMAYSNLGWILAVSSNPAVRNGQQALDDATRACELFNWQDANAMDNLAAANAETGNYADAVKWDNKYLSFPLEKAAADVGRQRLALYQQKKPYHEPAK